MYTGKYTCLEIFALAEKENEGIITVTATDGSVQTQKAGGRYYSWLKFPLEREAKYTIVAEHAQVTLAYLSGNEDILEEGIRFLSAGADGKLLEAEGFREKYDTCYREQYHFGPWANWINDPNGLCWYEGRYHMFYQFNPHGQEWSNMYWGHAVSRDLVHWTHLPVVFQPQDEILENPETLKGGAFSGCAVPYDDKVVFYLTYHRGPHTDGPETLQEQWMTQSRDMIHFDDAVQIISDKPKGVSFDFRDPKVISIGDAWYMVLGSKIEDEAAILLYKSADGKQWDYLHPLLTEAQREIRCFECPDFFMLDGKMVAMGAWMEHYDEQKRYQMSRWYAGDWDEEQMILEQSGWYDFGSNCYAMQSFEQEDRRISIGWISDFYGEHVEVPGGAYGSMTIPRQLHLKDNRLYMTPVEEIYSLKDQVIYEGKYVPSLVEIPNNSYYSRVTFTRNVPFTILLGRKGEKQIVFTNGPEGAGLKTSGTKSENIFFKADVKEVRELEIFVDRRVVEVYINQGEAAGTKLFYQSSKKGCFMMECDQPEAVEEMQITAMKSIWYE